MNSRLSWSIEDTDPSVRERAEDAARAGDSTPPNFRARPSKRPGQQAPAVADIHQRLDAITRQIEQISRPAPRHDMPRNDLRSEPPRGEAIVARQLNDAISRLDARLAQISNPAAAGQAQLEEQQRQTAMVERAAAQVYRPSPPLSPASLDFAIAEIAARQSELDNTAPRPMLPRSAPPMAPAMAPAAPAPAGPDFSSLERHLFKITSQIEALQRPHSASN
jgi:localization factor PodJL